jgi:hypothetical protein
MFLIEIHAQEGHAGLPEKYTDLDAAKEAAEKLYERDNGHTYLTEARYVVSEHGGSVLYSTKLMDKEGTVHCVQCSCALCPGMTYRIEPEGPVCYDCVNGEVHQDGPSEQTLLAQEGYHALRKERYFQQWKTNGVSEQDAKALLQEIKSKWGKHIEECNICTLDEDCPDMLDLIAQWTAINAYRKYLYISRTEGAGADE